MSHKPRGPHFLGFAAEALRRPRVYLVSFVVGTAINLYGQIIVPATRGTEDVWGSLLREYERYPFTVAFSVAIAYLFPLLVGVYQTVATLSEKEKH